jgi:hypothetical protein
MDFDKAYKADGWSNGIAWRVFAWETKPDEDTEWSGIRVNTGNVLAHMVGDDRDFVFDPLDLTPIADEDYCSECGQVGCKGDMSGLG